MKKALLGRLSDIKYRLSELTKKIDFRDVRITILLFLVCSYYENLMDIVGLESSEGLLNTWLYGFDPNAL